MWVVLVDMDQRPDARNVLPITGDDEWSMHKFESFEEIEELNMKHHLAGFEWVCVNLETQELVTI